MDDFLGPMIPIVAILSTFGIPAIIIIVLAKLRHDQRMALIRQGINPDAAIPAYPGKKGLFWGLLLSGLGIAFITVSVVSGHDNMMTPGIILLGAGIAILAYWKLTAPDRERQRKLYEQRFGAGLDDGGTAGIIPQVRENTERTAGD